MTAPAPPGRARPWVALVALALLAVLVAANLAWVRVHVLAAPPPWDQALYQFLSLRYRHAGQEGGARALLSEMATRPEVQPPLLPLTTLPFYAAFGETRLAAYAASSLYGCLLLGATALLARRRGGDAAALLAMVLCAGCSAPLLLARDYQMDLPAAALLAAAVVAVERSDGLRHRGWVVAAGALAGLMALAKTMAVPFLVAPVVYALRSTWRPEDRKRVGTNLLLAVGVAVGLASVWWGPHFGPAVRYLLHYGWGEGALPYDPLQGGSLLSLRNLGYYTVALANEGASVPFMAIAAALLALEAWRRLHADPRPPLDGLSWAWLLAAYLLLTLVRNKASDRYSIFLIPPLVVLVATALLRQSARWRPMGIAAALIATGAHYVGHTWPALGVRVLKWQPPLRLEAYTPRQTWLRTMSRIPPGEWPVGPVVAGLGAARMAYEEPLRATLAERALSSAAGSPEQRIRDAFRALLRRDPDPEALRLALRDLDAAGGSLAPLVARLAASRESAARPLRVLVLPDHPYVNASTLRYRAEWSRAPVAFEHLEPGREPPDLEDFDAVVVKTGIQGPDVSTTSLDLLQERLGRSRFRLLPARYRCPDRSEVRLYFLAAPIG
jgi:hypothetical protein